MSKYKILKTAAVLFLLFFTFQSAALAESLKCEIIQNNGEDKTVIKGTAAANEVVTVQILRKGYTLSGLTDADREEAVEFVSAVTADDEGLFEITAGIKSSGVYYAYLASPSFTDIDAGGKKLYFVFNSEYTENIIKELNQMLEKNDKDRFIKYLGDNKEKLGFEETLEGEGDFSSAAEIFYNECKKNGLTAEFDKNAKSFTECLAITALNKSKATKIYKYIEDVLKSDAVMNGFAAKHIKTEAAQQYFIRRLSGKNISGFESLKNECEKALILTAVKYPDGNINIKTVFEAYKELIGITGISSSGEVYAKLGGKEYADLTALKSAYDSAVSSGSTDKSGGGTGGGGTGKSIVSSSGVNKVEMSETDASANAVALKIKFNDLDSVDWAYADIAELYEKGIISGYDEFNFRPERPVTREQFVKMLICAAGMENIPADSAGFDDIKAGDWFEKYVNIAYANGLVNGTGKNIFGVGENIARQDMAVIIYNAIKVKGYAAENAQLAFDDADMCAEYAGDAIANLSAIGVINGVGDNKFDPAGTATRAQAAVILNKALKYLR